jgi:DNA-binding NtrC family response regulator
MSDRTANVGMLYTDGGTGSLRARRYMLRVISGPDTGLEQALDAGSLLIGTHENNDIQLKDPTISRYHMEIQVRASGIRIADQDSTNGTFLGKTRLGTVVVRGRALLKLGGGDTQIEVIPADEAIALEPFGGNRFGRAFGASEGMRDVFSLLSRVAPTDATVLLEGETGTGKELLAEGLHQHSHRSRAPFIVLDCGAVPRDLLAAELFGHIRGAFTGADQAREGLAQAAHGGTLFLDEIGELPLDLQPQLLRLLEKREVRPIGETRARQVNVRVVAATNRDLQKMIKSNQFREDLYFRLAVVKVQIPPLRRRLDDVPPMVRLFMDEMGKGEYEIPEALMQQLLEHDWPGNVRELRNVVERGMSLATARIMTSGMQPDPDAAPAGGDDSAGLPPMPADVMDLPFKEAKGMLVEVFEREYLVQLLDRHQGNISSAAREAGIDRNYIHRLVKKYGLGVPRR